MPETNLRRINKEFTRPKMQNEQTQKYDSFGPALVFYGNCQQQQIKYFDEKSLESENWVIDNFKQWQKFLWGTQNFCNSETQESTNIH